MSTFKPINKTLAGLCAIITVFVLSMILVFPAPIFAEDTGSISGNITPVTSNAAMPVTVNLKSSVYGQVIATTTANSTTGAYTLSGILYGDYVLEFTRVGYITRYSYISVNNSQINVADKTLIAGDVDGNLVVDSADTDLFWLAFNSVSSDSRYSPACDFDGNESIDPSDYGLLSGNYLKAVSDYNEGISFSGSVCGIIEPVTSNVSMPVTVNLISIEYGRVIASTTANSTTGEYILSGLWTGDFVLEFKRAGYITRFSHVSVSQSQTNVADKTLIAGDANGDLVVDLADYDLLTQAFNSVSTDSKYNLACDFDGNESIDPSDYGLLSGNFNSTVEDYNEGITFIGSLSGYIEPATYNINMPVTVNLRSKPYGQIIATTTVDDEGNYMLTGLWDGNFILEYTRVGYVTRYAKVTINHTQLNVPDKFLYAGDVNGDSIVDSADDTLFDLAFGSVSTDPNYNPACDFDGNGSIDPSDYGLLSADYGKTVKSYGGGITFNGSIVGYVDPATNNALIPTTVNLRSSPYGQIIATTTVDSNGDYSLNGLWDGNFVLEFSRAGYITRYTPVNVNHTQTNVDYKELIAGDVNGDLAINATDDNLFDLAFNSVSTDPNYNPACDFNGNGAIDTSDYSLLLGNFGSTIEDYNEDIDL